MSDLFCDLFSEQAQIKDEEVTISSTVEKEGVPRNGKRVFQEIKKLQGHLSDDGTLFMSCLDIFREIENNSGIANLSTKCRKLPFIVKKLINVELVDNKHWIAIDSKNTFAEMIPESKLDEFGIQQLTRSRKTRFQKIRLLNKLGIISPEAQNIEVPIECSVLDVFSRACPFQVELQYRVGKYRIDAYLPRLKIGIQIDENGHSGYNAAEEKVYDTVLRDHHMVVIRFVPNKNDPVESGLKLINVVWSRTLSPDYSEFKRTHNLA